MTDWTPTPPQSLNGWGQMVQGQLARHGDHLKYHDHRFQTVERALWELHRMVRQSSKPGSSEKPNWTADLIKDHWWQIATALFFLGAAYGKTGRIPDPISIIEALAAKWLAG
jgi:hypothetical protein